MTNENQIPYIQEADEYQAWALKTSPSNNFEASQRINKAYPFHATQVIKTETILTLFHATLGIQTEAGEFSDPLKKHIYYGKELDTQNMREELGDLLWYIAIAANALDTCFSELMTENIRKLAKRYPYRS